MKKFQINRNKVGKAYPCYIIAELSANHNQDFDLAVKSINAIKKTGANAVKIQTYTADSITLDSDLDWFKTREDSPWAGQKLHDVYKKGQTPWEWHSKLKRLAENLGLDFFSSPFETSLVDKLESIDVPAYKIASLEITDIPLIRKVAATGKPVIISTGAASKEDIELAITTCLKENNHQLALLKCTSAYPTPMEEVNLALLPKLGEDFNVIVGLSDHTFGNTVPIAAVTLGASIVEKHFTLDKGIDTLDRDFSLDPSEFKSLVEAIRDTEKAIGKADYTPTKRMENARKFTRSLFVVKDIKEGEAFSGSNIRSLRPGLGMHPQYYDQVIGKIASRDLEKGEPMRRDYIVSPKNK